MAQLQNIPSRNKPNEYDPRIQELGPEIREMFEAPKGKKLIVSDISQLELRLGAHFTHDPTLLAVYREYVEHCGFTFYTGDPHAETSRRMGVPRKLAKNLNFGLMYGMMAKAFARYAKLYRAGTTGYDVAAADEHVNNFHRTYSGVFAFHEELRKAWWQGVRAFATISGRMRHFEGFKSVAAGKIYNSKIQGSAADIMKVQLWALCQFVFSQPEFNGLIPTIQVHDEYVFEAPEETVQKCAVAVKFIMEYPFFQLDVPLLASTKICDNWKQKDDDSIPEVGTFFAQVKGTDGASHPVLYKPKDWPVFLEDEKAGNVEKKAAVAMLSDKQTRWARGLLPENAPVFTRQQGRRILSLEEYLKEKANAPDE